MPRRLLAFVLLLPMVAVDAAEVDAKKLAAEIGADEHRDVLAMAISRDGDAPIVARAKRYPARGLDIRSATKSITALLVGIAIDRGLLPSVDSPVAPLLPELGQAFADPQRARMRLRDLLTMRSGLDCDDWQPGSPGHEDTMYERRDWLAFWASVPMRDTPGERFSYCTGNAIALGRILGHATGKPLPEFAREALFEPLGIRGARWATWNRGRDTDSGGHLDIDIEAMRRIGQLVLDRGRWQGRTIVSAEWIDAMTTPHTAIPDRPQQYGYLWWIDQTRRPDLPHTRLLMAWGNGGNFIVVMPERHTVYATSGRRYNRPDALEPLVWLRDRVLPEW